MSLITTPVVISSGQSLSPAATLGINRLLLGIQMDSGWDAAALTFQMSPDGGTTWLEMQGAAAVLTYSAAASQYIAIDPTLWRGVNMLKIRSGTAGSPVNQTANRTLTLIST